MRKMSSAGSNPLRWLQAVLCCGLCGLLQTAAAQAVPIDLVKSLPGTRGAALDDLNSRLLFLQKQSTANHALWDLKSLQLTPGCKQGTAPCSVSTVATGFHQPEDVAVNPAAGVAYITSARSGPFVPFGASILWRVDLKTGSTKAMTYALSRAGQIALAPEVNAAYVTENSPFICFEADCVPGFIARVDLTTGAITRVDQDLSLFGLIVSEDRERAYVSLFDRVLEVDLGTGEPIRTVATNTGGVDALTFLAWADETESALYVLEVDEGFSLNKVSRVELATSKTSLVADNLGGVLSGIAVDPSGDSLYLSLSSKVIRLPLLTPPTTEPVFLSVGRVPVTSIDPDGYANSKPGDPLQVVDAPFGGTLDIFGNLFNFWSLNAAEYRILVRRIGDPPPNNFSPIVASWTTQRWNGTRFETVVVAPLPGTQPGRYAIPKEYSKTTTIPFWSPPYHMLRWQTFEKGKYELKVQIFNSAGTNITKKLPAAKNSLILQIDNHPPAVDLTDILSPDGVVEPCTIVRAPTANSFAFKLTADDPHGHLLGYSLSALWGRNRSGGIFSESYDTHGDEDGPHLWKGVKDAVLPNNNWSATCNCAYTFVLDAWKRTINGYSYILRSSSRQSVTLDNTGDSCE